MAHTHPHHARLPRWIEAGALWLSAVAGMVNAAAWLGLQRRGVSHVTGAVTDVGARLGSGVADSAWPALLAVVAFFLGAAASGALIEGEALKQGRRYGAGLVTVALLLAGGALGLESGHLRVADALTAGACGFQNALATRFSGAVLRTTHMTGLMTDLGLMLGHRLRGQVVPAWKLKLYLLLLGGFLGGVILGGVLHGYLGSHLLWVPAGLSMAAGLEYLLWQQLRRRRRARAAR